jgi:hypothetical protein
MDPFIHPNGDINGRMSNAVISGDAMVGFTSRNLGQYYAAEAGTGQVLWTSEGRQAVNVALAVRCVHESGQLQPFAMRDSRLVVLGTLVWALGFWLWALGCDRYHRPE